MSHTRQSILFINGLDKSVNESMLYSLFNDYSISYIKIAKDHITKQSFGYAFVVSFLSFYLSRDLSLIRKLKNALTS